MVIGFFLCSKPAVLFTDFMSHMCGPSPLLPISYPLLLVGHNMWMFTNWSHSDIRFGVSVLSNFMSVLS